MQSRRARAVAIAAGVTLVLAISGCTGATPEEEEETGPVTITFESWGEVQDVVDLFNETHDDVQVEFTQVPGADQAYAGYRASIEAGNAPDVGSMAFDQITTFAVEGNLEDVGEYVSDSKEEFATWAWDSVSPGGTSYGLPVDTGPVAFIYNKTIFDQLGLTVPTTWDEFRETAAAVKAADPSKVLMNVPSDAAAFASLLWQNQAKWFAIDSDAWAVDINGSPSVEVADYWNDLYADGLVGFAQGGAFGPDTYAAFDSGQVLAAIGAAWYPSVLAANMSASSGQWAVTPLPQWNSDAPSAGNWGGSGIVALKGTDHPEQAAEFITWYSTNQDALDILVGQNGIFPASKTGLASPVLDEPQEFFGGQPYFQVYRDVAPTVDPSWTWGPVMGTTYGTLGESLAGALSAKTDLAASLDTTQDATVSAMTDLGLSIAE